MPHAVAQSGIHPRGVKNGLIISQARHGVHEDPVGNVTREGPGPLWCGLEAEMVRWPVTLRGVAGLDGRDTVTHRPSHAELHGGRAGGSR